MACVQVCVRCTVDIFSGVWNIVLSSKQKGSGACKAVENVKKEEEEDTIHQVFYPCER